ncbi:hypothetical protein ABZ763_02680 [Streptomyces bacillaris]|uniref:hypothetical protein n=1 Tax=Streptomyces bacillaris TaxID=68179 RepID=UPI00345FD445
MRGLALRAARAALWVALPAELTLVVCLVGGVRITGAVLVAVEALVVGVLALEAAVMWPLYTARRRAGEAGGVRPAAGAERERPHAPVPR